MEFAQSTEPMCLLVDNGSLRPEATLALRRLASALTERIGRPVAPVSLLHANKMPPAKLKGVPAEVFDAALRSRVRAGARRFLVLPLFFGPSAGVVEYIPGRVKLLAAEVGPLDVRVAAPVAGPEPASPDGRLAEIVAENVHAVVRACGVARPVVVLVDHGSPQRAVTAVRDAVARQLAELLGNHARAVVAASMERRDGAAYDFNEPLLARALAAAPCGAGAGEVVLAPLFFFPGRHAGPGGDVETIAREAESRHAGLRVHLAALVGEHPKLVDVVADRWREAK
jgi:sirohydrochlorin ferrochelatase